MKITNPIDFGMSLEKTGSLIQKATHGGGFDCLSESEQEELNTLSRAIERYEDEVLKIMPLKASGISE